jgi:hypothetical protein
MEKLINWFFAGIPEHWMTEPLLKLTVAFFLGYLIGCLVLGIGRILTSRNKNSD